MSTIRLGGRTVEYVSEGVGPPVVLSSPTWWPLDAWYLSGIPELRDAYRVIAFNHRGIGQSDATPTDYSVPSLTTDMLDLLTALGVERAHVIGFAIGGALALEAARVAPRRVASLVVGAVGAGEPAGGGPAVPPSLVHELHEVGYEAYIRGHALNDDFAFSPENYRAHPERAARLADALWTHQGSEAEFLKHAAARRGYDTFADLQRLAVPALVVCGEEDAVARGRSTPVQVARDLAAGLPQAELLLVPHTRHMLYWEAPDVCWPRIREFLARATAAERT